eukprot:TRINITY_DN314_c1_g1_i1.p1 TRINITY_DN314_c1_g1~~TRINITY_DN314_c1_g1_i1.p1  ORF type:complete len:635 (-),score=159.21 TRINITY_DN314_c1_g1_i1:1009-2838(-)
MASVLSVGYGDAGQAKAQELFVHWLSLRETRDSIRSLLTQISQTGHIRTKRRRSIGETSSGSSMLSEDAKSETSDGGGMMQEEGMLDAASIFRGTKTQPPRSPKSPPAPLSFSVDGIWKKSTEISGTKLSSSGSPHKAKGENVSVDGKPKELPEVPAFYKPRSTLSVEEKEAHDIQIQQTMEGSGPRISESVFLELCDHLELPLYISILLFERLKERGPVTPESFMDVYQKRLRDGTPAARVFHCIRSLDRMGNYLVPEDFDMLVRIILDRHPGLAFLRDTAEFQDRYKEVLIARIFYVFDRTRCKRIYLRDFITQTPSFLKSLYWIEEEEDVNFVLDYFSYEHFYVLYCKFWELDTDHDLLISRQDLAKYGNFSLTSLAIDRVFDIFGLKQNEKMTLRDFVFFCMSEEDKQNERAIEMWFHVIDLDGDGFITCYEIEMFYAEQLRRMENLQQEVISFEDIYTQILDMLHPKDPTMIRLSDLKRCRLSPLFFNILVNLNKFIAWEQRDPFGSGTGLEEETDVETSQQVGENGEVLSPPENARRPLRRRVTDWDRFSRFEYDRMSIEEEKGADDFGQDLSGGDYDGDYGFGLGEGTVDSGSLGGWHEAPN